MTTDESECIKVVEGIGRGLYISGTVCDHPLSWFVDTGCAVTIMAHRVYSQLPKLTQPKLEPCSTPLKTATDSDIQVYGQALMTLNLGDQIIQHRVIVADVINDGLIGFDFMIEHEMIIDVAKNKISFGGSNVPVTCQRVMERACRVSVKEHVIIPAGTRTIIPVKASRPLSAGIWMVEPLNRTPGGQPVLVAKSLHRVAGQNLFVELINPTERDVTLHRFTNLGLVTRVYEPDVVCQIIPNDGGQMESSKLTSQTLDPEIQNILNQVDVDLTTDQLSEVENLLKRHETVFATKGQPLGRTDLVLHDIVTTEIGRAHV